VSETPEVTYRLLEEAEDQRQAEALFAVRGNPPSVGGAGPVMILMLGAFEGAQLLGATAGHVAPDDAQPARVEADRLRVTNLAVAATASGRGIGGSLMRLQRLMAIRQGLRLITWEQDLLDGRLAHLAVHKLGAVSRGLKRTPDGWLDIEWWVSSLRVRSRLAGERADLDLAHALEAGTPKLNAGRLGDDGLVRPTGGEAPPDSATALVEVPQDFGALDARDPDLASEWRAHLGRILAGAFAQGYWLTDYLWLQGERVPRAYYLLIDGERTLG
jgi:predicted GNAT superfamily acetyltransferase